jgi:hypothetical protein
VDAAEFIDQICDECFFLNAEVLGVLPDAASLMEQLSL